jgi:predicted flap endonuclease-1-like 5' DNA nuclease
LEKQLSLNALRVSIEDIEGIAEKNAQKLEEKAGITTVRALLESCVTPKQRQELAARTGISLKEVLKWAKMADLFRIRHVGEEYSELLLAAGVNSVVELRQWGRENLYAKMAEVNAEKKLVRKLPTQQRVKEWIDQAKVLPPILEL